MQTASLSLKVNMVKLPFLIIMILMPLLKHVSSEVEITPMLEMLDAMQLMMTGGEFDRIYYEELINCIDSIDPSIKIAQDGAWQGIINYWDTRGTASDPWGENDLVWVENNVTATEIRGMTINEPCGYASNIAYYYPVTEICTAQEAGKSFEMPQEFVNSLASGFSILAMGSAFMHGTHTHLGGQQDVSTLAVLAYEMHQASLNSLEQSSILHDLNSEFRQYTATEMIENLEDMYTNTPVTEWGDFTTSLDIPRHVLIYSGLVSSILTLSFSPNIVDGLVSILMDGFGVSEEIRTFIQDEYLPELRTATEGLNVNFFQRIRFLGNTIGTFAKLLYAFLWQEEVLTANVPFFFTPFANRIGIYLLPTVNRLASFLQTFEHFDQDFQDGRNIYPGDMFCNPVIPHAKWHLQSAIGLLDLFNLTDEIYKIISNM